MTTPDLRIDHHMLRLLVPSEERDVSVHEDSSHLVDQSLVLREDRHR